MTPREVEGRKLSAWEREVNLINLFVSAARDLLAIEVAAVRLALEAAPSPVAARPWPMDVVDLVLALHLLAAVAPVVPRRIGRSWATSSP